MPWRGHKEDFSGTSSILDLDQGGFYISIFSYYSCPFLYLYSKSLSFPLKKKTLKSLVDNQ